MKARTIHTKFYTSSRVLSLSKDARWLFMYYLTCEAINLVGAFRRADIFVTFETGLKQSEIERSKKELSDQKLVCFIGDWIVIPKTFEKTGYDKGVTTSKAYQKEFDSLPEEIREILINSDRVSQKVDRLSENNEGVSAFVDTTRNKKSEIRNKKSTGDARAKLDEAASAPAVKVLDRWNKVFGKNFTSSRAIRSNLEYWLETYTLEQIFEAIGRAKNHHFWKDKITPTIFLRRKNPRGEDVDVIGEMLNYGKQTVVKDESSHTQNLPKISEDQRKKNIVKLAEMRQKLSGGLSA